MKKLIFLLLVTLSPFALSGQDKVRLGLEGSYGFIIPHSADLVPISQTNPIGFTLQYQGLKTDQKSWDVCNCFHYLGLFFAYHNFQNPNVLGSAFTLAGSFEPILYRNKNWNLSFSTGVGFTYLTTVYDPVTNPENVFFSAPLSFLLYLTPKLEYQFSPSWSGQVSIAYNHISNGGQSQPNKGMNYPMIGIGVNHYLSNTTFPDYESRGFSDKWSKYVEMGLNTQYSESEERRRPTISLGFGLIRQITSINGLGGGVELTKDFSLQVERSRIEALIPAPFVAHHFLFGKFDFSQRFALYTHKPIGYNDFVFYQRYLLQYQVTDKINLGVSLKAHGHVAENLDLRLGWRF